MSAKLPKVHASAPERIFLCVSNDSESFDLPFPFGADAEVTWCEDPAVAVNVPYVRADSNEWADLWYFVMDEAPMEFERIVATYTPARWHAEAWKLYRAKYPK